MLRKNKVRLGVVAVAVASATLLGGLAANADPASGNYPVLAGVGSDTIQDAMNGMATVIPTIGSYDATAPASDTNTTTITTRSGGPAFTRPNGSGAGINALSASIDGSAFNGTVITGQVDFARSSSGPSSSFPGTNLTYIPFAKDAVSYAVNEASDFPRDIPEGSAAAAASNPTALTLWNIYHCTATSYTDSNANSVTIIPLLPQSGSGTRKFWDSTFGLTEGSLPSCVTDLNGSVEEHNGSALTGPGDIMPFSISQFIAQGNWQSLPSVVQERRYAAQLGAVDGIKPYILSGAGTTASPYSLVQNPAFEINRLVYNVVATSRLTSDTNIHNDFVGTTSAVCSATNIIKEYGFATIGAACGGTSITGGLTQ
jgi:hypothetical protein